VQRRNSFLDSHLKKAKIIVTFYSCGAILQFMPQLKLENDGLSRDELLRRAKRIPGAWAGLKIAVLILMHSGWRSGELSEIFGLSRQTLTRWVHEANERGAESLEKKSPPGRPGQLTKEIRNELEEDLENSPEHFGFNRKKWNAPLLAKHLDRQYGIKVKVRQARNYLRDIRDGAGIGEDLAAAGS